MISRRLSFLGCLLLLCSGLLLFAGRQESTYQPQDLQLETGIDLVITPAVSMMMPSASNCTSICVPNDCICLVCCNGSCTFVYGPPGCIPE